MAKIEPKNEASNEANRAPALGATEPPRLGTVVNVRIAAGVKLVNSDTGQFYPEDTPTPALVNITLLRRLQDGDLTLA